MFTSSLRSHNFKSGNISGKIRHCASQYPLCREFWHHGNYDIVEKILQKSWQTSDYELTHMKIWWQATHCITRQFKTIKGIKEKQTLQYNKQVSLLVKKHSLPSKIGLNFCSVKKIMSKNQILQKNWKNFVYCFSTLLQKVYFLSENSVSIPFSKQLRKCKQTADKSVNKLLCLWTKNVVL